MRTGLVSRRADPRVAPKALRQVLRDRRGRRRFRRGDGRGLRAIGVVCVRHVAQSAFRGEGGASKWNAGRCLPTSGPFWSLHRPNFAESKWNLPDMGPKLVSRPHSAQTRPNSANSARNRPVCFTEFDRCRGPDRPKSTPDLLREAKCGASSRTSTKSSPVELGQSSPDLDQIWPDIDQIRPNWLGVEQNGPGLDLNWHDFGQTWPEFDGPKSTRNDQSRPELGRPNLAKLRTRGGGT